MRGVPLTVISRKQSFSSMFISPGRAKSLLASFAQAAQAADAYRFS